MSSFRLNSEERLAAAWAGPGAAHELPARARDGAWPAADDGLVEVGASIPRAHARTGIRGGWIRTALRLLRDAAIGLAILTAVPFAIVAVASNERFTVGETMRERLAGADRLRGFMPPKNQSITPLQAGLAYRALQSAKSTDEFPLRDASPSGEKVWQTRKLQDDQFADLRSPQSDMPMASKVIARAARGVSADELAYLRAVAESPVWRDVERVASAPSIDLLGGQYALPFRADAFAPMMPLERFSDSKALAHAGVSRAAYYVAIGQPKEAEAALRTIIGYGFAMIDNGSNTLQALIGRVITDIGRDGLHQFYVATGRDALAASVALPEKTGRYQPMATPRVPFGQWQQRMLEQSHDTRLPIGVRYESLGQLAFGTCSSVRGMLSGPSAEVLQAFATARTTLARYPSEQAYLDLMLDAPNRVPEQFYQSPSLTMRLLIGASTVSSTVLHNPRIATCARLAILYD
jgi:hypothetical protein